MEEIHQASSHYRTTFKRRQGRGAHLSDWILDRLTGYGVRTGRLFMVTLFFVSFGMWMLWSDNALAEDEASADRIDRP